MHAFVLHSLNGIISWITLDCRSRPLAPVLFRKRSRQRWYPEGEFLYTEGKTLLSVSQPVCFTPWRFIQVLWVSGHTASTCSLLNRTLALFPWRLGEDGCRIQSSLLPSFYRLRPFHAGLTVHSQSPPGSPGHLVSHPTPRSVWVYWENIYLTQEYLIKAFLFLLLTPLSVGHSSVPFGVPKELR